MSDSASDTSEITVAPPQAGDSVDLPHPLVPSPALVPAMGPGAKDHARDIERDDFVRRLQQVVAGPKANSKYEGLRTRKPVVEPEDTPQEQAQDQPQEEPSALESDAEIEARAQDALKLLQELAHKSSGGEQKPSAPAAEPDATLASYLAAVDTADDAPLVPRLARPLPPATAEPLPPARSSAGRVARFAIAGCCALLAAGMTGVFLWSQVVPEPDVAPTARTEVIAAAPSAPAPTPVQAEVPPPRPELGECDLPVRKDPFADYFLASANPPGSNVRRMAEPSREDFGWYSLMAMKAKLDRRGGHC